MKTPIRTLSAFFILLLTLFTTGCKDNASLKVSASSITVSAETGEASFQIICDGEWKIKAQDDWCVVPASGINSQLIEIKAAVYGGVSSRQTTLTITNGAEVKTITVTQTGVGLSLGLETLNFPAEGGSKTISLLTDGFTWTIDALTDPTCTIVPMNGSGNKELTITVPENTSDISKTQVVTVRFNNRKVLFNIHQARWVKPENLTQVMEVAAFDSTFAKANESMSVTVNWKKPFSNEAALVKISMAEQKALLLKAKQNNNGIDIPLYVSDIQVWAAATAGYAAIEYKGDQTDFKEISKGESVANLAVNNKWTRLNLRFSRPCEITGEEDLFVGAYASNAVAGSFPFVLVSNNTNFPGPRAKYPSYGVCPEQERYLQELNDPKDTRWNTWVKDANWAMKLVLATEIKR